ncbi:hypothetical protein PIB30_037123 [Stylosanthes scabra]|uniref:Uncharacterized protein n=1 Tax=Stylosanthes scabra TaxID=79078 RepID=A0ABU6ZAN2_9FABA|nr:hypothetical protein [Stylosanthes scabra]
MVEGHYSYFRVLVITNIGPGIWAKANVVIEEETFSIFVKELEVRRTTTDKKEDSKETKEQIDSETPIMVVESGRHGNGNDGDETDGREAEGSRVGETQPTSEESGDGNETLGLNKGPMGEDTINEDECYVKPTNEYEAQSEGFITSNPMETTHGRMELESSSTSIPPGFGNVDTTETASEGLDTEKGRAGKQGRQNGSRRHMKIVLKLNDRLKENARKQKEARKRRTLKQRKLREIASEGKWLSSEEEIEDSDVEANEIWGVGMRTGLVTDKEDRTKNYLSSKIKEVTECNSRRYKQTEGRDGKKLKEVGVLNHTLI